MTGMAPRPAFDRIWARVHIDLSTPDACWLWTGATNGRYGKIKGDEPRSLVYVHRLVFEWFAGPIPEGMVVDHLCRTPLCVRPDHLRAATPRENLLNSDSTWAPLAAARTGRCARGHRTERRTDGRRRCKICDRDDARERMRRRRASA